MCINRLYKTRTIRSVCQACTSPNIWISDKLTSIINNSLPRSSRSLRRRIHSPLRNSAYRPCSRSAVSTANDRCCHFFLRFFFCDPLFFLFFCLPIRIRSFCNHVVAWDPTAFISYFYRIPSAGRFSHSLINFAFFYLCQNLTVRSAAFPNIKHICRNRHCILLILLCTRLRLLSCKKRIFRHISFSRTRSDLRPAIQIFQHLSRRIFIKFPDPVAGIIRCVSDIGKLLRIRKRHIQILTLFCWYKIEINIIFYFCLVTFLQYRFNPRCLYKWLLVFPFGRRYFRHAPRDQKHSRCRKQNASRFCVWFLHIKPPLYFGHLPHYIYLL